MRGTQSVGVHGSGRRRFIPACAGNSAALRPQRRSPPVHPRVCGELIITVNDESIGDGSSPRVRGTPTRRERSWLPARFIPACAGNSVVDDDSFTARDGSSPRVRGTRSILHPHAVSPRFIPACAGNSMRSRRSCPSTTVHPRVCGELARSVILGCSNVGSSPRVRGTPHAVNTFRSTTAVHPRVCGELRAWHRCAARAARFIPACAGNSLTPRPGSALWTVHPRVCGELRVRFGFGASGCGSSPRVRGTRERPNPAGTATAVHPRVCGELSCSCSCSILLVGSSPRVRGTPPRCPWRPGCGRFIPACAGNSRRWRVAASASTVHPRVCGELAGLRSSPTITAGSSPRVRGTPLDSGAPREPLTVHPRVCGELFEPGEIVAMPYGSSPRVRGTPGGRERRPTRRRFIPACAGNSGKM